MQRRDFLKAASAAAALPAANSILARAAAAPAAVTYDERSLMLHGNRELVICGEVHYPRSTRAMWPVVLERSKAMGLNMISTYVFWNVHEPQRGVYDFSGERDLGLYLDLCQQKGLDVFLRVGPYICAEWNFGGFPPYLRDEPNITIRTMNPAYLARVEAFFYKLAEVVKPRLASRGGPVVLVQVENEYTNVSKRYGEAGQEYLRWIVELARRVGLTSVPTTTCEGGAAGAIETSNGFSIPPERIAAVRKSHPGTPLLWTELYPAWYRVWGGRIAAPRDPRAIAGSILEFVSGGGSGWSYYMWHGGSNFGRNSMYLQTPTYDFYAPLDEFGAVTETGVYLGKFHAIMRDHTATLLEGIRTQSTTGNFTTTTWRSGNTELQLLRGTDNTTARLVDGTGKVILDLDAMQQDTARSFSASNWQAIGEDLPLSGWETWPEPLPAAREDKGTTSVQPVEQLSLTKDATDYCWYSSSLSVASAGPMDIVIPFGADLFYLFLDGAPVATSKLPLQEDRGPITPEDPARPRIVANISENNKVDGFRHTFTLPALTPGEHRLDILACAVGMIKGDWQIASSMNYERKGIWEGVLAGGKPLNNWTMRHGLAGETTNLHQPGAGTNWTPAADPKPLRWYRTAVAVAPALLKGSNVFRLDANSLGKGMAWINGHPIGRYWLIEAQRPSEVPSQRFYHIPADWLKESNQLVLFEEQSALPSRVQLQYRA